MADADLTIVILRQVQGDLVELKSDMKEIKSRVSSLDEKQEVTNERLAMVERGVVMCAAQINVMRRHMGIEDNKSNDAIRDLQMRAARVEDVVKP